MDLDRPHHHTTTTTSELFICFTSRLSSSSMKLSKSILSPNHARHEPPLSLPPSLSRRLKANGSIKGGQSPATFPTTTGRKRGSGFDNPEPSSPKVTCIGQVKMKTKKKVRQTRSLSNRRIDNVSFRKQEQQGVPEERGLVIQKNQKSSGVQFQSQDQCAAVTAAAHRNQRWVHLPLTIYEALREFSCLFPCRSSCFSTNEKEKETKVNGSKEVGNNVVARWLVALQDGEAEKMEEMQSTMRSSRRHVFEGIEFKDHEIVEMKEESVEEEEKGRVSICIPPKNALLLMRCRSDPMKMADITNRFWELPTRKETDEEVEEEDKKEIGENECAEELVDAQNIECKVVEETSVFLDLVETEENLEAVEVMEMEIESSKAEEKFKSGELRIETTEKEDEEESEINALVAAEVNSIEQVPDNRVPEPEKEEKESSIQSYSSVPQNSNEECTERENEGIVAKDDTTLEVEEDDDDEKFKSTIEKLIEETLLLENIDGEVVEEVKSDAVISVPEKNEIEQEDMTDVEHRKESRKQQNESILPDCLLLMMYEPKLSMEVSKETWVYSNTEKMKISLSEEPNKSQHLPPQPPRSSCSFPATGVPGAMSMATIIEQKLGTSMAYEPFVLTRCKSEPMRTAATAAKLAPESCYWKNRKIEPHRRATFGFGAAGVGF